MERGKLKSKRVITLIFAAIVSLPLITTAMLYESTPNSQLSSANTRSPIGAPGVPAKVVVTLTPNKLHATPGWRYYVIKVELQDLYGNPAYAPDWGMGISLSSSNPVVGDVTPKSVTIGAGVTYQVAHFGPTWTPGTTTISASAPGLMTGSAVMTTWGRTPTKLKLFLAPNKTLADDQYYYNPVIVQLQDSAGNPALAPSGGIGVSLSSSVLGVGWVPRGFAIAEGWSHGVTWFHSTLVPGTTDITVVAAGLASSTATMTTVSPGVDPASKVVLWLAPTMLPALNRGEGYSVVAQIQDASGTPVKPATTRTVLFESTNLPVGTVSPPSVGITSPASHAYASFVSTWVPGSTTIWARSSGLTNSSRVMTTDGNKAQKLAVLLGPSKMFAHKLINWGYIVWVQPQDNAGNPARAPAGDISVGLSSSNPSVGTVSSGSLTINAGWEANYVAFSSTFVSGTTTITATAGGYGTGSAVMKTVAPRPNKLALDLAPSKLFADGKTYYRVVRILLLDSTGNPALAPVGGISVSLTSSDLARGSVESSVTIAEGWFYTTAWFKSTSTPGTTTITATAMIGGVSKSASAPMTTVSPSVNPPAKVAVIPLPKYVSIARRHYDTVIVHLLDSAGNPANAPTSGLDVQISSSDPLIGGVPTGFTIGGGWNYGYTWYDTSWVPGTTTINVAATGSVITPISGSTGTGTYPGSPKTYNFGSMVTLFYKDTFLVVGNAAAANEAMSAAVFGPALTAKGTLPPTIKTDTLLTTTEKTTKNLIAFGFNNTVRTSYPLGIVVSQNAAWFNITATAEGKSINFTKSDYPIKSVGVVYLAKNGTRAIMFMWGYGWQGTYAAALFMSDTAKWQTYATKHLLFLQWTDTNTNGFVEKTEITVATSA